MKVTPTSIKDVLVIEPRVFEDERGFFFESFNQLSFNEAVGSEIKFVQDNHSRSIKGVLRGLHYQKTPYAQGKLVRVIAGEVFDVAVDLRETSPTFKQWVGVNLSAENRRQLWIPEGFAHGFLVLSDVAEFLYKTTSYWNSAFECTIRWDEPTLAIEWPLKLEPVVSLKDQQGSLFEQAFHFK